MTEQKLKKVVGAKLYFNNRVSGKVLTFFARVPESGMPGFIEKIKERHKADVVVLKTED